jgi:hypothetical protein
MRKILASLLVSGLVLVPAASAWAGGGRTPSDRASIAEAASSADPSGSKELWAYGCHQGQVYGIYLTDKGNLRGTVFPLLLCSGPDTLYYANQ